jgi:phage tail sheath protein FI
VKARRPSPAGLLLPGWKYVNVRRPLLFREESLDSGTQWAVFEPE